MKHAFSSLISQGRRDFFHSASLYSPLKDHIFEEDSSKEIYCTGIDYALCNGIIDKNEDYIPSEEEINNVIEFFVSRKKPFLWWTSNKNLENFNFQYGGMLIGITLDISNNALPLPTLPPKLSIEHVTSDENIKMFSNVAVEAFKMPSHTAEQFAKVNIEVAKADEQVHFLAYLNDLPVATVTLSTHKNSAGIWNLATLPEYRKSGIGKALMTTALIEAKKRGHDQLMAILMPKGMALGICMQLGFAEVSKFPFYVFGTSSDELE